MKPIFASIAAAGLTLAATPALAEGPGAPGPGAGPMYGYGHMWGGGWGGWYPGFGIHPFGMFLAMLLVAAAFVVLVVWLVRWLTHPGWHFHGHHHGWHQGPGRSTALDILEERFARGEIDKAEFEDKRRLLNR